MTEESFFNKLKKGMALDEEKSETTGGTASKKREIREIPIEIDSEKEEEAPETVEEKAAPTKTRKTTSGGRKVQVKKKEDGQWPKAEGQLAVDVYQTDSELVIQSAIAGVKPENLDISIEKDLVTIKGEREKPVQEKGDYFYQECYWGGFSRQIILPVEVDPGRIDATLKEGILMIRMPKIMREGKKKIEVTIREE